MSQYGALRLCEPRLDLDEILDRYYAGAQLGPAPVAGVRVLLGEAKGAVKLALQGAVPRPRRDRCRASRSPRASSCSGRSSRCPRTPPRPRWPGRSSSPRAPSRSGSTGPTEARSPSVHGAGAERREQVGLDAVPRGRRHAGDAERLARRGAESAGRRRPLLCARGAAGRPVRSTSTASAQPGLRRGRGERPSRTAAVPCNEGPRAPLRGQADRRLFPSSSGGQPLAAVEVPRKAVPYLVCGRRPVQRDLARQSLGTDTHDRGGAKGAEAAQAADRARATRGPSGRVAERRRWTAAGTTKVTGASFARPPACARRGSRAWPRSRSRGRVPLRLRQAAAGDREGPPACPERCSRSASTASGQRSPRPGATLPSVSSSRLRVPDLGGKVTGAVLKVRIAPVVTARADATGTGSGAVKPIAPGTTVELQTDDGGGWATAAQETTGAGRRVHVRAAGARSVPRRVAPRGIRRGAFGTDRAR